MRLKTSRQQRKSPDPEQGDRDIACQGKKIFFTYDMMPGSFQRILYLVLRIAL